MIYENDDCPNCEGGIMECIDCKGMEYLECNKCGYTFHTEEK